MRYLLVKYADMSFAVVDRTFKDPAQAVIGYSYGHFEEVTNL